MNALSEIVIAKRNERGLSQRALAVKSKINNATISRIEKGEGDPNPDTLRKLAVALGISVDTLFEACGYAEKRTLGEGLEYMFPEQSLIEKIISTLPLINTPVSAGSGAWLATVTNMNCASLKMLPMMQISLCESGATQCRRCITMTILFM